MRHNNSLIPVFLTAALSACLSAQAETSDVEAVQGGAGTSSQKAKETKTAPIQLAQYPGAPLEDRNGNLWFATVLEGLIRYDGTEFVTDLDPVSWTSRLEL